MDENRLQGYLNFIQELLNCTNGEEQQILDANPDLVDTGLMQMMLVTAADLVGKTQLEEANHLINIVKLLQVKILSSNSDTEELSILQTYIYTESNRQQSSTLISRIRGLIEAVGINTPVESATEWNVYIGPGNSQSPIIGSFTAFGGAKPSTPPDNAHPPERPLFPNAFPPQNPPPVKE